MSGQPTDTETYYDLLDVSEDAAPENIKKAYRYLVKEYHPDRIPEHLGRLRQDAAERFGLITEAYQILRDPVRRAAYDRQLEKLRRASRPQSASAPGPPGSGARARSGSRSGPSRRRTGTGSSTSSTGSQASPSARQRVRPPSRLVAFLQSDEVLQLVGVVLGPVLFAAVSVAGAQGAMHVLDSVQAFSLAFWLASAVLIACIPGVLLAMAIVFGLALLWGVLWVVVWVVQYLLANPF